MQADLKELIAEMKGLPVPSFRFNYPLPLFSDERISLDDLARKLEQRNSFLRHAESTDVKEVVERARALYGVQEVVQPFFPEKKIITVSLTGSYVYHRWNQGKGNDMDANVIVVGNWFWHKEIPAELLRHRFPDIPKGVENLEIVVIGYDNAVHGKPTPTGDSFETTTGRSNVVPVTTAGLWNGNVPIYGLDYNQIPKNEPNLLRLAYELIMSAILRYEGTKLKKPESRHYSMIKAACRLNEAGVYLEDVAEGLNHANSKIPLLQTKGSGNDELEQYRVRVGLALERTITRYLEIREHFRLT